MPPNYGTINIDDIEDQYHYDGDIGILLASIGLNPPDVDADVYEEYLEYRGLKEDYKKFKDKLAKIKDM